MAESGSIRGLDATHKKTRLVHTINTTFRSGIPMKRSAHLPRWLRLGSVSLVGLTIMGCHGCAHDSSKDDAENEADSGQAGTTTLQRATDGGATSRVPPEYSGPFLMGTFMQSPIMSDMDWPNKPGGRQDPARAHVMRIGYIRRGGKVPVIATPHPKANCTEGWYELLDGGFVCAKYATLDENHPKVRLAPHAPRMDEPLPYDYGYNLTNGTPLYKHIPSHADRELYEPWLTKRAAPRNADPPSGSEIGSADDPLGIGLGSDDVVDETPWYLRKWDGGKPKVTLDDLVEDGPVARRMVRGFFLALDREEEGKDRKKTKWWKSTAGLLAPHDRIMVQKLKTAFHGVWLSAQGPDAEDKLVPFAGNPPRLDDDEDGGAPAVLATPPTKLPVAFVQWKARTYRIDEDGGTVKVTGDTLPRFTTLGLTGDRKDIDHTRYLKTIDDFWIRARDIRITEPPPPPKDLAPGEKWVAVNLRSQTLVAFNGTTPVYATLVSTGKKDPDPDKTHETKTGEFRIREKHIAATMDGDEATDGPYSIEDVPWIMYFNGSIALHGAFWHTGFGKERSHGCVNLSPQDARAMFRWTEPHIPRGWHGVWSTPERPGTRVIVHE